MADGGKGENHQYSGKDSQAAASANVNPFSPSSTGCSGAGLGGDRYHACGGEVIGMIKADDSRQIFQAAKGDQ